MKLKYALGLTIGAAGLLLGHLTRGLIGVLPAPPVLRIDPAVLDLGQVGTGQVYTGTFTIENKGRMPLSVERLKVSCTCTIAEMCTSPIAPGRKASIKLHVQAPYAEKGFASSLTIQTNDPANPQADLHIQGQAVSVLKVAPLTLLFGDVSVRDLPATKRLTVLPGKLANPGAMERLDVTCNNEDVTTTMCRVEGQVAVEVTICPNTPLGVLQDRIRLTLKGRDDYVMDVPLVAAIKGDYQVNPASFVFGNVVSGVSATQQCQISPVDNEDEVEVVRIKSNREQSGDSLAFEVERIPGKATVKARFTAGPGRGVLEGTVWIKVARNKGLQSQYLRAPILAIVGPSASAQIPPESEPGLRDRFPTLRVGEESSIRHAPQIPDTTLPGT